MRNTLRSSLALQPSNCLAIISIEKDAIVDICRDGSSGIAAISRLTGLAESDLETGSVYQAATEFGGWLLIDLDQQTADICDFLIADVMGGASAAIQVAKRFANLRAYVRSKLPDSIPDFLHDREESDDE